MGNNIAIAEKLNLQNLEPLDLTEKHPIGNIGYLEQALSVEEFKAKLQNSFDFKVIHLPAENKVFKKWASVQAVLKILLLKLLYKIAMLIFQAKSVNELL